MRWEGAEGMRRVEPLTGGPARGGVAKPLATSCCSKLPKRRGCAGAAIWGVCGPSATCAGSHDPQQHPQAAESSAMPLCFLSGVDMPGHWPGARCLEWLWRIAIRMRTWFWPDCCLANCLRLAVTTFCIRLHLSSGMQLLILCTSHAEL